VNYEDFLDQKQRRAPAVGFDAELPYFLFPFQREMLRLNFQRGRSADFADCGLGKTPIQLAWADGVRRQTNKPVLILAPLAVSEQTKREGDKFGIDVKTVRSDEQCSYGINVTNYEMLGHFTPDKFGGIVLDESGILKNFNGSTRKEITEFARSIHYRLACTATPAPNDIVEITNHSEFLDYGLGKEILALYFRQDGNTTHKWRLKGHAQRDFWAWMASWAVAVRKPSDMGFDDGKFVLPPLATIQHTVSGHIEEGWLFQVEAHTLQERNQARRESMKDRVGLCAELANNNNRPWLIWCGLNAESELLTAAIPDAIEVKGSDSNDHKRDALLGFSDGKYRVLVTKPSIAGWGMNWQHCRDMAFVGLSDSWEQYYQAVRRCWRFGQTEQVNAHLIVADTEGAVVANIERKERQAEHMMSELVRHMGQTVKKNEYQQSTAKNIKLPSWIGA